MSSHDVPIGQTWNPHDSRTVTVLHVIRDQLGDDPALLRRVLAYFVGGNPALVLHQVYLVAHADGRHSGGRCPEQCPEF